MGVSMLKEAGYYARMAWYFGDLVRRPPIDDCRGLLRENLARRIENFLELVRIGVYENPISPFHELLRLAGCGFEDLARAVRRDGLEPALEQLKSAGVYLSHAEAKGAPIERHGRTILNDAAATATPASPGGLESVSGGSRSRGTATPTSNDYRLFREAYETVMLQELRAADRVLATLQPILPAPSGLWFCAASARRDQPVERWFCAGGTLRDSWHYRAATKLLIREARLLGRIIPSPMYLDTDDFSPVVDWIAVRKKQGRPAFVRSNASACTRVSANAKERGQDIEGTIFLISGEGISEAKRKVIEDVGVRAYARYVASEVGTIGMGCPHLTGNSVHLFSDSLAVISQRRHAPFADVEVNSLLFTSINRYSSRIFINVEMEDEATLVRAECDCEFSRLGFNTVLQDVQSFGKLTGHGITLAGTAFVQLLEDWLPQRFGGAPGDYQLVEQQAASQVELRLRISPRIPNVDPMKVQAFFLDAIRTVHGGAVSRRTWEQTASVRAEIAEPYRTRTGKVLALHLAAFRGGHAH